MKSGLSPLLLLAALLAAATAAVTNDFLKSLQTNIKTCTEKHGTSKADVLRLIAEQILPETPELKCTVDCYMMESGYLKDGKIDWEALKASNKDKFIDEQESAEKADKIVNICKEKVNIDGKKECEFGEALLACMYPEAKKVNLASPDFFKAPKEV